MGTYQKQRGVWLQTQPSIKPTLYKTWENPERFPKTNCTNQAPCSWGSFCCTDALWIHRYHSKDGALTAANECKHEYKHQEILLVFKNKQKTEWNRRTLLFFSRTCLDRLPNPCLQQLPGSLIPASFLHPSLRQEFWHTACLHWFPLCHHLRSSECQRKDMGSFLLSLVSAAWVV